ncbi:nickel-dependent hydrogenase large subunit [Candidatus Bathyarchaeota archaeon]|nr:nickel-dependent hydrogenase large subunit [Candidatus Bathyarchaeota archaeon]
MSTIFPIGPFHLALKEAALLKLEVEGERIVGGDIKLGYMHRGIEELATKKSYHSNIFLAERVCGICNTAHSTCYAQTVEALMGIDPPARAGYIRTIVFEAERLQSHLLWFGVGMHEIGYDTAYMYMWMEREHALDMLEAICGKRVNLGINTLGGVRRDITPDKMSFIRTKLDLLERAVRKTGKLIGEDRVVKARVKDVGVLTRDEAKRLCVVGPTARGSGVNIDTRRDDPYAAYPNVEFDVPVEEGGDVLSRTLVRLRELSQSIKIIRQALNDMPGGPIALEELPFPRVGEALGRVEAHRGELVYYIRSDGTNSPERVKIRTPSVVNNNSLIPMMLGETIADAPIILASIDPCFSCTDRVTIVDVRKNKEKTMTLSDLRRGRPA